MTISWPVLLTSPIQDEAELAEIRADHARVTVPARHEWVMARVAALLSQYYASDVPQGAVRMMAEDWAAELGEYPEWAITKAVRWWKSRENPSRKRRPLEGDISERARFEMGPVFVAESAMRRYSPQRDVDPQPSRPPVSDAQKAEADRLVASFAKRAGMSREAAE